jgi:hypothetical protein
MRKRKMLYKLCKIGEKYLKWNTWKLEWPG